MNQRDKWKKFIPVMAILAIAVILVFDRENIRGTIIR